MAVTAQHTNNVSAILKDSTKVISIKQNFRYFNNSQDTLNTLYFNDWNNAYSSNTTALSKRFGEDFDRRLHLAKPHERGFTKITYIKDSANANISWDRTVHADILKIELKKPLPPNQTVELNFRYLLRLPEAKFTGYGHRNDGGYYLKDWYLTPAVYDGEWHLYPNKGLEDLYTEVMDTRIDLTFPPNLYFASNFRYQNVSTFPQGQNVALSAIKRKNAVVILDKTKAFTTHITPYLQVTTDLDAVRYDEIAQGISINRINKYITDNLGQYPHGNLLVSSYEYKKNPLYGLNQLPSFIRPYDEQFQFEMAYLKTSLNSFLEETLFMDPRKERWVNDAIANYLTIKFVEEFYPDQKLIGKLANIWGVKGFHLAKMDFNEQYTLLQMLPSRSNIDQSLTTPNDSLIKFNQKIANRYKAGSGLAYLANYIGKERVDSTIIDFYNVHKLASRTNVSDFEAVLTACSDDDVSWFFNEYVKTRAKIDFKIKNLKKTEDSVTFTLKNKTGTNVPISLFGLKNDTVVAKYWFKDIDTSRTITLPRAGAEKLVLNYDQKIPEFNQRDNWKTLNGFFSSNKKLKFTFFKDTENPYYNQVFYVPIANFNIYDGLTPGLRLYNKPFLERPFTYDISPTYSFAEKTMVGRASLRYRKYHGKSGLYVSNYGVSGGTSHFQENSRFSTLTPFMSFAWRPDDLRSNKRQILTLRHRNVFRNIGENVLRNDDIDLDLENNPDYSVFNARYLNYNNNLINYRSGTIDFQHAAQFTKVSVELEYRRLFESNRQLNLRFFAGKFIRNKTNSDFFSFALDRPTDYMFDLNYLGRSESSGLTSQQIIIAEGGFKTQYEDQFGSDWIATLNGSINVWRWIELYGDVGFIADRGESAWFAYDSGVRLNLVTDYFELYLPVYSNKGWEIAQPEYEKSIRFIVTVSPKTLIGLFTRKWF